MCLRAKRPRSPREGLTIEVWERPDRRGAFVSPASRRADPSGLDTAASPRKRAHSLAVRPARALAKYGGASEADGVEAHTDGSNLRAPPLTVEIVDYSVRNSILPHRFPHPSAKIAADYGEQRRTNIEPVSLSRLSIPCELRDPPRSASPN